MQAPKPLAEIVAEHDDSEALLAALYEREDAIADLLRMAAAQLGTYPEFVAHVLAEVTLGTPLPDDVRALLFVQFQARAARIAGGDYSL